MRGGAAARGRVAGGASAAVARSPRPVPAASDVAAPRLRLLLIVLCARGTRGDACAERRAKLWRSVRGAAPDGGTLFANASATASPDGGGRVIVSTMLWEGLAPSGIWRPKVATLRSRQTLVTTSQK